MIEVSRYVLAVIVAQTHLWPKGQEWTGQIAVFAFYTLSGYLITRVLNVRYGFTWNGTRRFVEFFFPYTNANPLCRYRHECSRDRPGHLRLPTVAAAGKAAGDVLVAFDRTMQLSTACALFRALAGEALRVYHFGHTLHWGIDGLVHHREC